MTDATTAVVALLPDAEPLLDQVRAIAPELVRPLPAHVSLLYPGPEFTTEVVADLRAVAAELPQEVELRELMLGEEGFLGIAVPELDTPIRQLRRRYPHLVPYDGRFGADPPAHLTLALGADEAQLTQVHQFITRELPRRSRLAGPHLLRRTEQGWQPFTAH
ncbi:hypothetical protein BAY60_36030 (plasmid) [Prauserella muralis]|uniref:2'-5' RNA ligase n=1 Tax=Prauserella muralis TaxID=588067 RepID=A0A2V4AC03_9PSEU|nr:hypothetical protein BAY60_36030 [Prauserella muralis]